MFLVSYEIQLLTFQTKLFVSAFQSFLALFYDKNSIGYVVFKHQNGANSIYFRIKFVKIASEIFIQMTYQSR